MDDRRTVTFPIKVWIAAGVFAVLMVGLLAGNLLGIAKQKQLLTQQLAEIDRASDATLPAVKDARPLLDDARGRLPETRRDARDAAALVREARPLVAEARPLLEDLRPLLRDAVGEDALGRLVELTVRAHDLLERIDRLDAVEQLPELARLQRELLSVQRRTLAAQLESLAVQKQTLAIQQEALRHIRSIDQKTGGTAPPVR